MRRYTLRLARVFAELLAKELGPRRMALVVSRNQLPKYRGCCASHDFCDANVVMARAFRRVVGRASRSSSAGDTACINAAWDLAKGARFVPSLVSYVAGGAVFVKLDARR